MYTDKRIEIISEEEQRNDIESDSYYITYGDSYKFFETNASGFYTIKNNDGTYTLKEIKGNEKGKYTK